MSEAIEKAYCNPCRERGDDYNEVRCRACDFDSAINQIDAVPPTEPKRLQGKWINDIRYPGWTCTHCNYHDGNRTDNYCPNCGASMKGADDEEGV